MKTLGVAALCRAVLHAVFFLSALLPATASAGLDDCVKLAVNGASAQDLEKVAKFAVNHGSCLDEFLPPTTVPYLALSGSLDVANKSGALNKVGLGFGNDYGQCVAKLDPGKTAVKQLAPVLKPVCGTLNMNCGLFESEAGDQINAQIASQVPLLSLMPCACAAATSGLGVEKLAELSKSAQKCGGTVAEVAKAVGKAAEGAYKTGGKVLAAAGDLAGDVTGEAAELGKAVLGTIGDAGCAVAGLVGGCKKGPPPNWQTTANAICAKRGGVWMAASKTEKPDDVNLRCMDGLQCKAEPGKQLICQQGKSKAATDKDNADWIENNPKRCLARGGKLKDGYALRCRDGQCKAAMVFVAAEYASDCTKSTADSAVPGPIEAWAAQRDDFYAKKFESLIAESIRRDPKASPVEVLATYECRPFLGRVGESLCKDAQGFAACKKYVDAGKMSLCQQANGPRYPLVSIDAAVKTPAIVGATPKLGAVPAAMDEEVARLGKLGCSAPPEAADARVCTQAPGYDACVALVQAGKLKSCRNSQTGQSYPALKLAPAVRQLQPGTAPGTPRQ